MNKSTLLVLGSALVFGPPQIASAFDDDPGYGPFRPWYGGEDRTYRRYDDDRDRRRMEPVYYRPTQRYFAKGFTVNYRYLPVYWYELYNGDINSSSNFRTEAFHIATKDIPAWRAKSPRLVVPNRKPPTQNAITSIIPANSNSGPYYGMPALVPSALDPLPTPNLDPTPATAPAPKP